MFSERFGLAVVLSTHARERMAARDMNESLLLDIIETGVDKDAGAGHHWIYKHYPRGTTTSCASPQYWTMYLW